MTVYAQIIGAMVTALQQAPAVSANVFRARTRPVAEQATDAVVVRPLTSDFEYFAVRGAPMNADTRVAVECYARSSTLTPDAAVDTLMGAAYARLMADPTLGGLVSDVLIEALNYDFDEEAQRMACVTFTLLVRHRTAALTLE